MKPMKLYVKILILVIFALLVFIPIGAYTIYANPSTIEYDGVYMRPSKDIMDNLSYSPETNRFASLLDSASASAMLHEPGPFTVFAPTNTAYNNLSDEFTDSLKSPKQKDALRQLLGYHVVRGKYLAEDLKNGMELTTIQGEKLKFYKGKDFWVINGYSYLEVYNIESKNGVIHTVTSFAIPPSKIK